MTEYQFKGTYGLLRGIVNQTPWSWWKKCWVAWKASKLPTFAEQKQFIMSNLNQKEEAGNDSSGQKKGD